LALVEEQSVRFCGRSASESDPDPGFLHVFDRKLAAVIVKDCFGYDPAPPGVDDLDSGSWIFITDVR